MELIELAGLDAEATEQLGTAMAGGELEAESARWLYQRTSGNALFVTEILRTLGDAGRLEHVGDHIRIDVGSARRSVPLSLRALLGARIDALPAGPRGALELAAVIGMSFPEWLLCDLHGVESEASELQLLAQAGIVVRSDDCGEGLGRWRFKNQLFMDAAYGRLLAPRRRQLHAALADRLELVEPPVGAAELARHRVAAGETRARPAAAASGRSGSGRDGCPGGGRGFRQRRGRASRRRSGEVPATFPPSSSRQPPAGKGTARHSVALHAAAAIFAWPEIEGWK